MDGSQYKRAGLSLERSVASRSHAHTCATPSGAHFASKRMSPHDRACCSTSLRSQVQSRCRATRRSTSLWDAIPSGSLGRRILLSHSGHPCMWLEAVFTHVRAWLLCITGAETCRLVYTVVIQVRPCQESPVSWGSNFCEVARHGCSRFGRCCSCPALRRDARAARSSKSSLKSSL